MSTKRSNISIALLVALLAVTGCTGVRRPAGDAAPTPADSVAGPPGPSPTRGPCRAELAEPDSGLLRVKDVWPETTSQFQGYQTVGLDRDACTAGFGRPGDPDCSRSFPWISESPQQTDAILAEAGVEYVYTGVIRGHFALPDSEVIQPLELRQMIAVSHPDQDARDNPIAVAARACGSAMSGAPYPAYRTRVRGGDGEIVGVLAIPDSSTLMWLEFDEPGWQESHYLPVLKKAGAKAAEL